ncbi:MAG: elongation factor G [Clostridiales bacterium]|nr:elongation factor G [Candidatus Crickella merdequi]
MKGYSSDKIRNVVLLGHGGSGKTTFLEAALLNTKVITRLGKVEDGNTVSDYEKMEKEKGYTINSTLVPVEYNGTKINFIDTPGFFDFQGEPRSALTIADAAVIFVDASAGVQVGTEKAWELVKEYNTPSFIVINKTDKDNVKVDAVVEELRAKFGTSVVTDDDKDAMDEAVAGADEELMMKYFEGEPFTDEEFTTGLHNGIKSGDITPIIKASCYTGEGIDEILGCFAKYLPSPLEHAPFKSIDGTDINVEENGDPCLYVFKTLADPFLGKVSYAKVVSGSLKAGVELYNARTEKTEKLGSVFFLRGKTQENTDSVACGDIVALGKLQHTKTGDTLCMKAKPVQMEGIKFPKPCYFIAVEAADKNEDEKMAQGLIKLMEEDPSFVLERNAETHQTLLGGQGDIQINIIIAKLLDRYKVKVKVVPQKIAYRETIRGTSDVQGKHKKQSGGAGQYGDVHIRFSPSAEPGLEFSEELFGGSVPKNYVPAVEKGLLECMEKGPLAGCKVQNIKAVLYDGSYHEVDSNEVSFKIAASLAFKKGIVEANPVLLEPIMSLDIKVPADYVGNVIGGLAGVRGQMLGQDQDGDKVVVHAEAPQSELFDYAIKLRAMTQARGSFTVEFSRYDVLQPNLAEKVISAYKAEQEEK